MHDEVGGVEGGGRPNTACRLRFDMFDVRVCDADGIAFHGMQAWEVGGIIV